MPVGSDSGVERAKKRESGKITQNGLSMKIFSTALLRPMACHPLIFFHLELRETFPVMCHGGQTLTPTQPWYPKLISLLIDMPRLCSDNRDIVFSKEA